MVSTFVYCSGIPVPELTLHTHAKPIAWRSSRIWRRVEIRWTTDGHFVRIVLWRQQHCEMRADVAIENDQNDVDCTTLSAIFDINRARTWSVLIFENLRERKAWIRDDWLCVSTITNHIQSTDRRQNIYWWPLFRPTNSPPPAANRSPPPLFPPVRWRPSRLSKGCRKKYPVRFIGGFLSNRLEFQNEILQRHVVVLLSHNSVVAHN